jgi:phosphoribosyl-ATP pyrophosphohydrolase
MSVSFLTELEQFLIERKQQLPEGSYTAALFSSGMDRILKKIGEEAGEVIIAAKNNNKEELTNESADLLFHLLVTLVDNNISITEVVAVLKSRHINA